MPKHALGLHSSRSKLAITWEVCVCVCVWSRSIHIPHPTPLPKKIGDHPWQKRTYLFRVRFYGFLVQSNTEVGKPQTLNPQPSGRTYRPSSEKNPSFGDALVCLPDVGPAFEVVYELLKLDPQYLHKKPKSLKCTEIPGARRVHAQTETANAKSMNGVDFR